MGNSTWPLWTALIPVASFLMTLLGIWLFKRARRKVDDHPICRECGFDLFGLPESSVRCPECGSDLAQRDAVRMGNSVASTRRRAAVALIALSSLFTLFIGLEVYGRVDFLPIKPDWWLALELDSKSVERRNLALVALFERQKQRAVSERICLKLEDTFLAQSALSVYRSEGREWAVDRILSDKNPSQERQEKMVRAFLPPKVFVLNSSDAPLGRTLITVMTRVESASPGHHFLVGPKFNVTLVGTVRTRVDGEPIELRRTNRSNTISMGTTQTAFIYVVPPTSLAKLKVGQHAIEIEAEYELSMQAPASQIGSEELRPIAKVLLKESEKIEVRFPITVSTKPTTAQAQ